MPGPRPVERTRPPAQPGRDRTNARGDATRELILLTAERLFAEHGIATVPLRDIGVAAGQRNNVAVQYHFGDRETLVRAIAAHRAHFIDELSADASAAMAADHEAQPADEVVRRFVYALAANIEQGNSYLPFLARYITERGGYAGLEDALPQEAILTLRENQARNFPGVPEVELEEHWQVLATSAIHTLARYQIGQKRGDLPLPLDELLENLVRFLSAGLEASIGSPAAAR